MKYLQLGGHERCRETEEEERLGRQKEMVTFLSGIRFLKGWYLAFNRANVLDKIGFSLFNKNKCNKMNKRYQSKQHKASKIKISVKLNKTSSR